MKKKERLKRIRAILMAAALVFSLIKVPVANAAGSDLKDTVPPVIEKVEFAQNNATLHPGDMVSIKVYAYDLDSGMDRAYATIFTSGAGDEMQEDLSTKDYNAEEKSFTLKWVIPETFHTQGVIGELGVSDKDGNIAEWKVVDEQQQPVYQYKISGKETEKDGFEVQNFVFGNGQSIEQGTNLHFSFKLVKKDQNAEYPELVRLNFKQGPEGVLVPYYAQHKGDGLYEHNFGIDQNAPLGKRVLAEIKSEASGELIACEGKENIWFEVVEGNWDHEKPVITSVVVDKNKTTVKAGEKVHVEVKATDNKALDKEVAFANFETAIKLDMGKGWKSVPLSYEEGKQAFVGDFVVDEETYPCEWYLTDIGIFDEENNRADLTAFDSEFEMQYPYYFYVANEEGIAPAIYKQVRIYAETIDENGNVNSGLYKEYQNVERRTTLNELGFLFPKTAESYEGKKFVRWEIKNIYKPVVTGSWQIIDHANLGLESYDLRISPVYEEDGVCNHEWVKSNVNAPTCTEEGYTEYTCRLCQSVKKDDVTEKIPHTSDHVTDCTKVSKCTVCGTILRESGVHTYDAGVVTVEPTCLEKGEKIFTCKICGHAKKKELAAKGHSWETTTTEEKIIRKCSFCEEKQTIVLAKAEGIEVTFNDEVYNYLTEKGYKDIVLQTELVSESDLNEKQKNALKELSKDMKLVELTLKAVVYDADGTIAKETILSQLGGTAVVKVAYDAPENMDGKVVKVCYISEDGKVEEKPAFYKNGEVAFTTEHFSTYAIYPADKAGNIEDDNADLGKNNTQEKDNANKSDVPQTGDTGAGMIWVVFGCASALIGIMVYKKRAY